MVLVSGRSYTFTLKRWDSYLMHRGSAILYNRRQGHVRGGHEGAGVVGVYEKLSALTMPNV